jgi:hypothetical protein
LHGGNFAYASTFGGDGIRLMVVKVNPKNVVSVPINETSKMRVCEYKVIDELPQDNFKQLDQSYISV